MQAIIFYLVYPFVYLLSSLSFRVLYRVSDVLYRLLKWSGYRRSVIQENLRKSFPEKKDSEIDKITNLYYKYLCDLILETLKTRNMTVEEVNERCKFNKPEWLDRLAQEGQSFIIIMGHYGNWEWAGPSFMLNAKHQLVVIYRPLSDPYFEKMMTRMRTRFGTRITPVNHTLRDMVANRKQLTATAFIADQSATPVNAYWTTFLNQDTPVFTGPEKLAVKFDYPVVYVTLRRVRRGYYEVFLEMLCAVPKETTENQISEAFMHRLEQEIQQDPVIWLWSHRRWKHKRPKGQ